MKLKRIWITWENQRRNRELSQAFRAELFELAAIDKIENPFKKYIYGIIKTLNILFKEKPKLVFCQNPSIVLSFVLVLIRHLFQIKLCVDAHNAGLFPTEARSSLLMRLSRFIQRRADLVFVTNQALREHVEENGGNAFVLQDKIPCIPLRKRTKKLAGKVSFLFICSYADDEPFEMVFDAAASLPHDICIYVTGNYKRKQINPSDLPANVILTGFIPMSEFEELLCSVDATIDLTSRENCLVCGAYESVAVGKPMVLSDTSALREYFSAGAVYTQHSVDSICSAILDVADNLEEATKQVTRLRNTLDADWDKRRKLLELYLSRLFR